MFERLILTAAITAATTGSVMATPTVSTDGVGDLALVPYYTVRDGFITGVHVTNTSDKTQVVKMRLRNGRDSMDAMDFNLILSPNDVWTGWISQEGDDIRFRSTDTSCTAPMLDSENGLTMPEVFREGAEEGYIEVIGMGQIDVDSPIGYASKHVDGVPRDCTAVSTNFFSIGSDYPQAAGVLAQRGVQNKGVSHQTVPVARQGDFTCVEDVCVNAFEDAGNALKVSYFIRNAETGLEFGGEATHVENFLNEPAMTNQQQGLSVGDLSGYNYPDLNGGAIDGTRDLFDTLRSPEVLGVSSIVNDWSTNPINGVSTDWVVTFPGQYTMLDLAGYVKGAEDCTAENDCDHRDLPVSVDYTIYDREEGVYTPEQDGLVVSPTVKEKEEQEYMLSREVNVIHWGTDTVFESEDSTTVENPIDSMFGYAQLGLTGSPSSAVCELQGWATTNMVEPDVGDFVCVEPVNQYIPVIGFVAWERSFVANPDANYGRIVEHSYIVSSN